MKKILVAVALVMLMAASAQAAFLDAISINLAGGNSTGLVSGSQTGGAGAAGNWINMTGGHSANWAAQIDGGGWTSGTFDSALTNNGATVNGSFRIDMYDGGWNANSIWNDGTVAANALGRAGISNGDMPNNWGPTGLGIDINNVPGTFATAGYNIWVLGGATKDSGASLSWTKVNGVPLTSTDPANFTLNSLGFRSVAAIQIAAVPEPATMSLLVLGGIATLIRRRNRR